MPSDFAPTTVDHLDTQRALIAQPRNVAIITDVTRVLPQQNMGVAGVPFGKFAQKATSSSAQATHNATTRTALRRVPGSAI